MSGIGEIQIRTIELKPKRSVYWSIRGWRERGVYGGGDAGWSYARLCSFLGLLLSAVASPLPQPIAGWQIEVVAEAPQVQHPSVVVAAPDGRIFVAEDPMDISLPKADAAEGRILCLHPNGQVTVFADKLYAVFGLQYLEGKMYVLHNPKFSVFEDDHGVGRNRHELIERTLPEPWALNWNDHVPANFHLGMDGYFYAASGDKGLYGAQGTDGSRADLATGGIFRLRPDGTQLEVYAHGVRNILDVALNREDERFTYDNTDEHDWMGRFTHMIEAGYYGYPHDFNPRRPYTLWLIDDYGAGAACGVFANTEDALPTEFRDNLFLSDFGKRQVMRVRVERAGGTYRAISKEDLFPNPPGDFRPVGISPTADGRGFYICDWQYRDEKATNSVGRLLKLTWTGADQSMAKPAWYMEAATGKPISAKTSELLHGLSHSSRNVRLMAQRRLAERNAREELLQVVKDPNAGELARTHAIWALDAVAGGRTERSAILRATADPSPLVRRQAIRQLGTQRAVTAVAELTERLRDSEASVRLQAAIALGRIGDAAAIPALLPALEELDDFTRYAVFTALNRIGTNVPSAWPAIVRGLENSAPRVLEGTTFALRETFDPQLLAALVNCFHSAGAAAPARRAALALIAALHHQPPAWEGHWGAYHPALQPAPAKTVAWSGTALVLSTLRAGLREKDPTLRRAAIEALAGADDQESATALRELFPLETEPRSRATILLALGRLKDSAALTLIVAELKERSHLDTTLAALGAAENIGGDTAIEALTGYLSSVDAPPGALASALAGLGKLHATSAAATVASLTQHNAALVRAAAFRALGQLQGERSVPALERGLADSNFEVRRAVVRALGELKSPQAIPALLQAYADESLRADALPAITRTPDERALTPLLDGLASKNPTDRNAAHLAIRQLSPKVLPAIAARADTLPALALTGLRQIYAGNAKAEASSIFAKEILQFSLEEYSAAATKGIGNPQNGQKLFAESGGVNCIACHRVAGQGGEVGPDLSAAGTQFDRATLAEAILYPSKTVREGYQVMTLELNDGEEINGIVKGETAQTLTLRDSSGREHILPLTSIKARHTSAVSLMPEGLQTGLSLQEFTDLVAYLSSLKGKL